MLHYLQVSILPPKYVHIFSIGPLEKAEAQWLYVIYLMIYCINVLITVLGKILKKGITTYNQKGLKSDLCFNMYCCYVPQNC